MKIIHNIVSTFQLNFILIFLKIKYMDYLKESYPEVYRVLKILGYFNLS